MTDQEELKRWEQLEQYYNSKVLGHEREIRKAQERVQKLRRELNGHKTQRDVVKRMLAKLRGTPKQVAGDD